MADATASQPWWRPCVAELIGVFALVAVGAGSIIALYNWNIAAGGQQDAAVVVGVALAHGLAIATMVMALGHISGGHFNPAVTVAAMATRRITVGLGALYIVFQLAGGVLGGGVLAMMLPQDWWLNVKLGTPSLQPALSPARGLLIEALMTFFLTIVIFGIGMDKRNPARVVGGLAIGLAVTMNIFLGGFITGAALNPARAFGTAVIADAFDHHYIYWAGPILGALVAGLVYDLAFVDNKVQPSAIPPAPAPPEVGLSEPEPSPPLT